MNTVYLDQNYSVPDYPKIDVFRFNEKSNYISSLRYSTDVAYGYGNPYLVFLNANRAMFELQHAKEEARPFEVTMAAMCVMYWAIKGMEYNYGGVKSGKLQKQVADYSWMCKGYTTFEMFQRVDELRSELEKFGGSDLAKLSDITDVKQFGQVCELYFKLMLLIYDYILGASIYSVDGLRGSKDNGYVVNTFVHNYGDIAWSQSSIEKDISYYDDRSMKGIKLTDVLRPELVKAYKKGREELMDAVLGRDPKFPHENTWLYYGIDVTELNHWIVPIYGDEIGSCRCEKKRLNIRANASGISNFFRESVFADFAPFYKFLYRYLLVPLFVSSLVTGNNDSSVLFAVTFIITFIAMFIFFKMFGKKTDKIEKLYKKSGKTMYYPFIFGKITSEEKPLRRTIKLIH